jgi:hypothetical protein
MPVIIRSINLAKVASIVAAAIQLSDLEQLEKTRSDLITLRQVVFGSPAASTRPELYKRIGQLDQAIRTAKSRAAEARVELLTTRIDQQIAAARAVLAETGKDPAARLESVRAHLRVAWDARMQLGGPQADPVLRDTLGYLCRCDDGKDGRPKFFDELEKEFKEFDKLCEELIVEADRLKAIDRTNAKMLPKGNRSLRIGRGVVLA